jgi:hypothetical protein
MAVDKKAHAITLQAASAAPNLGAANQPSRTLLQFL